jgi:hypothetical protein
MALHRLEQRRHESLQALATDPVRGFPDHDESLANRIVVNPASGARSLCLVRKALPKRAHPRPALTGFSGPTNLSATPGRPTCPSRASGWSSLTPSWGFPCCVRFPCVHAAATTPVQQMGLNVAHTHPAVSAFPERVVGSACTSSFSRLAQRSLTLRPAHSRGHQCVTRTPKDRVARIDW